MAIPSVRLRNFKGNVTDVADYLIDNEASPYMLNVCNDTGPLGPLPGFTRVSSTPITPANYDIQYAYLGAVQYRYNSGLQYASGLGGSTTSLVSYWTLETAGSTIAVAGGTTNTLTKAGTITAVPAQFDYGSRFDDTSGVWSIADASQSGLDITSTYTITAYIKISNYASAGPGIIGKGTSAYTIRINSSGNLVVTQGSATVATSTGTITLNTPVHIAVVYDDTANTVSIYFNAVLDSTTSSVTTNPTNNSAAFCIGADTAGGNSFYASSLNANNFIDDVSIWTRALTSAEILQIKQSGIAAFCTAVGSFSSVLGLSTPAAPTVASYTVRTMATTSSTCNAVANSEFFDNVSEEGTYAFFQTYYVPSQGIESSPSPVASVDIAHSCSVVSSAGTWAYKGCQLTPNGPDTSWGADCVVKLYGGGGHGFGYFGSVLDGTVLKLTSTPGSSQELPDVFAPIAPPTGNAIFSFNENIFVIQDSKAYYSCFPVNSLTKLAYSETHRLDLDSSDGSIGGTQSAFIGGIGTARFAIIYSPKKIIGVTGNSWKDYKKNTFVLSREGGGVNKYAAVADKQGTIYVFGGDCGITRIKQDFSIENIALPIMDVLLGENSLLTLDTTAYESVRTLYDPRRNWVYFFVRKSGSSENDVAIIWDASLEQWYFKDRIPGRAAWSAVDADGQVSLYTCDAAGYQYQISDNAYLDYSMGGTNTGNPTSTVASNATTITDTGASFTTTGQSLKDAYIILIEGNTIVKAVIASNTGTVITLTGAIGTAFTTAAKYYIGWQDCQWRSKYFDNDSADLKEVVRNIAIDAVKAASAQNLYVDFYTDYNATARQTTRAVPLATQETPTIVNVNQRFNYLQLRLRSITSTRNPLIREIALPIQQRDRI